MPFVQGDNWLRFSNGLLCTGTPMPRCCTNNSGALAVYVPFATERKAADPGCMSKRK